MSKLKVEEEKLIAWVKKELGKLGHLIESDAAKIAPGLIAVLNKVEAGLASKSLTVLVDAFDIAEKTDLPAEFIAILKNQLLNLMKFALALQVVYDPNSTVGEIEASVKAVAEAYHMPLTQKDQFITSVGANLIKQWEALKNVPESTFGKAVVVLEHSFDNAVAEFYTPE